MRSLWGFYPSAGILRKSLVADSGAFSGWASEPVIGVTVPADHVPIVTAAQRHPLHPDIFWYGECDYSGNARLYKCDGSAIALVWTGAVPSECGVTDIWVGAADPTYSIYFTVGRVRWASVNHSTGGLGLYTNTDGGGTAFTFVGRGQDGWRIDASSDDYPGQRSVVVDVDANYIWCWGGRRRNNGNVSYSHDNGVTWTDDSAGINVSGQQQMQRGFLIPRSGVGGVPGAGMTGEALSVQGQLGGGFSGYDVNSHRYFGPLDWVPEGGFFPSDARAYIGAHPPGTAPSGAKVIGVDFEAGVSYSANWSVADSASTPIFNPSAFISDTELAVVFFDVTNNVIRVSTDGGGSFGSHIPTDYTLDEFNRFFWTTGEPITPVPIPGNELWLGWLDYGLATRITIVHGFPNVCELVDALGIFSNASIVEYICAPVVIDDTEPDPFLFAGVGDVLILQCQTIVNNDNPLIVVPAPKAALFLADGVTLDKTNFDYLAAEGEIVGHASSPSGNLVTNIESGRLLRRSLGIR